MLAVWGGADDGSRVHPGALSNRTAPTRAPWGEVRASADATGAHPRRVRDLRRTDCSRTASHAHSAGVAGPVVARPAPSHAAGGRRRPALAGRRSGGGEEGHPPGV